MDIHHLEERTGEKRRKDELKEQRGGRDELDGRERNIKTKDIQLNDSADVFYKKRKLKRGGVKRRHNGKRKLGLTPMDAVFSSPV